MLQLLHTSLMEGNLKTTGPPTRGGRGLVTALLFLLAGLLPTLIAVRVLTNRIDRQMEAILEDDSNSIRDAVSGGLERYADVLHGASGLFAGSEFGVKRREWKEYYLSQDFEDRLPGIQSLQFLERVTLDEYDAYMQRVRSDTSRDSRGYPTFRVTPSGSRPEYYIVTYVEPMEENLDVFGFDAFSDPRQKAAIEQARDDGTSILAGRDATKTGNPDFVLFDPVYRGLGTPATIAERRAFVEGMVSLRFDQEALFADLLEGTGERGGMLLDIEVHDGSQFDPESGSSVLYHRQGSLGEDAASARVRTETVVFSGQELVLVIKAPARYGQDATETYLPILAAIFGTALPIAAFAVFLALERSRQSALQLAMGATREVKEKSKELAESNRRLEDDVRGRTAALDQKIAELEGSKTAILNVLEDLTFAKEQVETGQAYDQALLASITDGIIATDTKGIITEANEAALRILGRTKEELVGKKLAETLPLTENDGDPIPKEKRPILLSLQGTVGRVYTDSEHYFQRSTGERFPVALDAGPIIMAGKVQGAIEVFRDITKEKEIDRAKSEFVSLASHQLRTPLTAIGWYTELLMGDSGTPLTPEQQGHLAEISTANKRMVDLVDALLNVSRLELGTMTLALEPTQVKDLVRRTIAEFSVQIAARNLRVDEKYPDTDIVLTTDPRMLSVVVENVVSNAIKYSPPDKPITVTAAVEGNLFVLSVTDKGIGIPQAQQEKLFTKLFRADNARLSDTDGNGLGLYLAKSIVDRLGGTITFVSKEGQGSTFTVRVPIAGPPPLPAGGV